MNWKGMSITLPEESMERMFKFKKVSLCLLQKINHAKRQLDIDQDAIKVKLDNMEIHHSLKYIQDTLQS